MLGIKIKKRFIQVRHNPMEVVDMDVRHVTRPNLGDLVDWDQQLSPALW